MDARELAVVVVGLLGTYCLPWPAAELAGEARMQAAATTQPEAVQRAERVPANSAMPAGAKACAMHGY